MRELKQSEVQEVSGGFFGLFGLFGRRSYGCRSYRRSYSYSSCRSYTYRRPSCGSRRAW